MNEAGRMVDGDILLLLLQGEDHELRLILRTDARGTFHYMLLGGYLFQMSMGSFFRQRRIIARSLKAITSLMILGRPQ